MFSDSEKVELFRKLKKRKNSAYLKKKNIKISGEFLITHGFGFLRQKFKERRKFIKNKILFSTHFTKSCRDIFFSLSLSFSPVIYQMII